VKKDIEEKKGKRKPKKIKNIGFRRGAPPPQPSSETGDYGGL